MRKEVYISELSRHIRKLPAADIKDIIADYEEHFTNGRAAGKTDEQIVQSLGMPKAVGQEIMMNTLVTTAETSTTLVQRSEVVLRMLLLFLVLAPFNFLMLVCPFLVLACLLMAGWAIPFALVAAAIGIVAFIFQNFALIGVVGILTGLSMACMWIGTIGIAVLISLVMLVLTKGLLNLIIAYVKWNVNFITARKA